MVSITGFGPGLVDNVLAQNGLTRKIKVKVPHFLAASFIVASTDLVVTLPRKVGLLLSQQKKIILLEPPLKIPSFSIYLYWHIRNKNNPTHTWVRKIIRENS
jgi:DNA-binding transcriptional LysR family regulator